MNDSRDEQIEEAVEQRAAEWFVRHREGELAPQEQHQYMQWLRASPRHVEAYLSLIGLTAKLPEAIAGLGEDVEAIARRVGESSQPPEQALFPGIRSSVSPRLFPRLRSFAVTFALLMMVSGVYWISQTHSAGQSIVVPLRQQRVLTFPDGSVAQLNSDTHVRVHYSDSQRLIELMDGQGLFNVTHDARRPFIVRSGHVDVVALGTQFDVYRRSSHTEVTVVEGKIEIIGDGPGNQASPITPLRMAAGEQVRIDAAGRSAQPVPVDARLATAWSRKEVTFSDERLEDVATRFNHYTGAHITIEDANLRDYRISGVFQAYDVDSFVGYLRALGGVVIDREDSSDGDVIRVRRGTVTKDSAKMR